MAIAQVMLEVHEVGSSPIPHVYVTGGSWIMEGNSVLITPISPTEFKVQLVPKK